MDDYLSNVAIIGAGLGGCALALALSQHKIPVTVFEARQPTSEVIKSGVVLTPNGLRVLDRLGVLARIKDRCYIATHRVIKNDKDETVRKSVVADPSLYGYRNHRIWRRILLDEMRAMLAERGVHIEYGSKFTGIASDRPDGVTFHINDKAHSASLLVGSDGIYSSVRKHLSPDVAPEYTGTVGILAHIKRASVAWPSEEYERNATIQGEPGALFFIPEDPEAEDIMIGTQVRHPEQSRQDLDRLQHDADRLVEFYRRDYEKWGPTARSIIDRVTENKETCYIWPYLKMPKLEKWYSDTGRVILVADGAHALPPSSGQGVNQALEDVYSLTLLLTSLASPSANGAVAKTTTTTAPHARTRDPAGVQDALLFWQSMRQERVDAVFDWATNSQNVDRLPEAERKKLIAEGKMKEGENKGDDMSWLYTPKLEEDVEAWISNRKETME